MTCRWNLESASGSCRPPRHQQQLAVAGPADVQIGAIRDAAKNRCLRNMVNAYLRAETRG